MELVADWGTDAITERLSMLTGRLAEGLPNAGVTVSPTHLRAPHVLSLSFPDGMPQELPERLAAENVFVSPRLGRLRISPHVYNDEADVDRFLEAFRKATRKVLILLPLPLREGVGGRGGRMYCPPPYRATPPSKGRRVTAPYHPFTRGQTATTSSPPSTT